MTINATPHPESEARAASLRAGDELCLGDDAHAPVRVASVDAATHTVELVPLDRPHRRRVLTFTAIDALGIFDLKRADS